MRPTFYRLNVVPDPDGQLADLLDELIDNGALVPIDPGLVCPHNPQCDPITYCVDAVKREDR